jgi:ABC-type uncharacterized transport system permease subunit
MKTNRKFLGKFISFWIGVIVISIINVLLNVLDKNKPAYNIYILIISIVILIITIRIVIKRKRKIKELNTI